MSLEVKRIFEILKKYLVENRQPRISVNVTDLARILHEDPELQKALNIIASVCFEVYNGDPELTDLCVADMLKQALSQIGLKPVFSSLRQSTRT